jgi:hypothetical protein
MNHRGYTRRSAIQTIGLGAVGAVGASTGADATIRSTLDTRRPNDRFQFVDADPGAGFNFPYWLATPEEVRSEPVPLLVTMNSAREGQPLTGGGPDKPPTVAEQARSQVQSLEQVGAWASEQLGVPHLVPVFPQPDGNPVDSTHKTTLLDRETMLIEGTDLERIDRQLLRMTEHARREVLADRLMHDQLLFWGNSSGGVAAEHMAVMHPKKVMAFAASGINGIATLPLETLDSHTLNYPVGVADLGAITGNPFDAEAFDGVNKFYIHGGRDTHNRLKFEVPGELPGVWADPEVYATAKAVYGRDMVGDRFPRCHIAFEKAGISGQFRIYPEMTHDPEPSGPDVVEFLRRSIANKDVSEFGQRLTLPFDRTVALKTSEPRVGDSLDFAVSGQYPPPEGLVTYTWQADTGGSKSGLEATVGFEEPGNYDLTVAMETAHGQSAQRGMSLLANGSSFAALQYAVDPPGTDILVGESLPVDIDVTNVGSVVGTRSLALLVGGDTISTRDLEIDPDSSQRITFEHSFEETGTYDVRIPPAYKQTISVQADTTPTPTPPQPETKPTSTKRPRSSPPETPETTQTSVQAPGFGVVTALVGITSALGYIVLTDTSGNG